MKKFLVVVMLSMFLGGLLMTQSCNDASTSNHEAEKPDSNQFLVQHPDWIKSANIYEVNLRQYSKNGTIKEFEDHLPRLKEMGVDILWFMPVHPIGVKNRKGTLGSYYSVKDYTAVNPEYGTFEEFKALVNKVHEMGMFVIIDWVANHTSWDHQWTIDHPEFYTKDSLGNFIPPIGTDWSDVIDLNYDNEELRTEMINSLKFWIDSADIDGFRCDVAGWVPTDFWNDARAELDKVKPVFMLAEAEQIDLHYKSFDASYGWEFHHIMNEIAKGKKSVLAIDEYFLKDTVYPANAIRMQFITNHDENSWNGTIQERLGDAAKTFAVLYYTIPGMPLIYSGQEAGLNKRLKFFEKDEIDWELDKELESFYKSLISLKKENSALWNGDNGAALQRIKTSNDSVAYAFVREDKDSRVLVIMNLSNADARFSLNTDADFKGMKEYFSKDEFESNDFDLKPWEYRVYIKSARL